MVEGIPAFFAASRYGGALIALMAVVFALSTILTYVALCVLSTAGLQRIPLGPVERYGEAIFWSSYRSGWRCVLGMAGHLRGGMARSAPKASVIPTGKAVLAAPFSRA
jgi:hypothetical protein